MPIAGAVISTRPEETAIAVALLSGLTGVEVHGTDGRGAIVAVLETATTAAMEHLIRTMSAFAPILHVGLTFLNAEDEMAAQAGCLASRPEETG